jgi:hypothetical protein
LQRVGSLSCGNRSQAGESAPTVVCLVAVEVRERLGCIARRIRQRPQRPVTSPAPALVGARPFVHVICGRWHTLDTTVVVRAHWPRRPLGRKYRAGRPDIDQQVTNSSVAVVISLFVQPAPGILPRFINRHSHTRFNAVELLKSIRPVHCGHQFAIKDLCSEHARRVDPVADIATVGCALGLGSAIWTTRFGSGGGPTRHGSPAVRRLADQLRDHTLAVDAVERIATRTGIASAAELAGCALTDPVLADRTVVTRSR